MVAMDPRYPLGRFSSPAEYTPALRAEHIRDIAEAPDKVRAAVEGLSSDQLLTPYREGGWTVAQVVHHLADSHMNAYVRTKLAMTEDNPTIKPYDEGAWARSADATGTDLGDSLRLLDALHARWVRFARTFQPADFARTLVHPERGAMTIDRTLALYAWHGRHHVAHITELRRNRGW
jgi:uncharacterized damage-inducible protein DinB